MPRQNVSVAGKLVHHGCAPARNNVARKVETLRSEDKTGSKDE